MKVNANALGELLSPLRQYFQKDGFTRKEVSKDSPLRSELFSIEQLEHHAAILAKAHHLSHLPAPEQLLKRLDENREILIRVNNLLQDAVLEKTVITPAEEWLLDNYYLVEEQIRIAKRYLPKGYSIALPKLSKGSSAGLPRVYDIALEIISHSDGHIDLQRLSSFIKSYQGINHLTLGELWAIPIMLRLALLENLRRVAASIGIDRIDANLAHDWAEKIIQTSEKDPKNLVIVIADMARSAPPMVSAFVAEFTRKLQWKGPNLNFVLTWIEQHLAESEYAVKSLVLAENQKQAADQVSISNSISSLRFLAKMDWREFVEGMSEVERILAEDHDGVYPAMDFYTRDRYRHQVEKIAKQGRKEEKDVARLAINLARESLLKNPHNAREAHVGYYLIDDGVGSLEKITLQHQSFFQKIKKMDGRNSYGMYVLSTSTITLGIAFGLMVKARSDGITSYMLVLVALLGLLAATHFAFAIINWIATLRVKPMPLPRMNYASGIPVDCRTMVVVPTLLSSREQAEKLLNDLEIRFLSNRDPSLHFALLTDLKDSTEAVLPEDEILIQWVKSRIVELNLKYESSGSDNFFLFHRPRQWNEAEKVWMGYERKRGKLTELNHLLRGALPTRFSEIVGESNIYKRVRYVITLDTDTQLPRESAWKLVGMMAHPLNHPFYNERTKTITKGYGIIQPRIAISLQGATRSLFTKMNESDAGIDPYTNVTSDVYQDIFKEGSFIGKGIYDVDTFEKVLNDRFPDNRILSHDLLEGSYVRCGFASDVQFYEKYPSRYQEDIQRRHRWIRGDWQIGNWFFPWVPDHGGKLKRNHLSVLSRWKIFDNLRRSLVPIGIVLLQLLAWAILPSPWFWTFSLIGIIVLPSLLISVWNLAHKPEEVDLWHHFKNASKSTTQTIVQAVFTLICLPYEAFMNADAIVRTLWRLWFSRRKLLEWSPSGFLSDQKASLFAVYQSMWIIPVLVTMALLYVILNPSSNGGIAFPFLFLWFFSPTVVWWFSRAQPSTLSVLTGNQKIFLRMLARKTWSFFENVIGPGDNWLPPDNLQEYPIPVIAHRTSPTNLGISLLASLSAHDFGYCTTTQLLGSIANTFDSMGRLERFRGHFYNWYDTKSLNVLLPKYISTVDSGNLAGYLLTLKQGLLMLPGQKIIDLKVFEGLLDTARLVESEIRPMVPSGFPSVLREFEMAAQASVDDPLQLKKRLENLQTQYETWSERHQIQNPISQTFWKQELPRQMNAVIKEFTNHVPQVAHLQTPQIFEKITLTRSISSLTDLAVMDKEILSMPEYVNSSAYSESENEWLAQWAASVNRISTRAREQIDVIRKLCAQCDDYSDMEYDFLYDKSLHLLSIGYSVDSHQRDVSYYDLLASEARLGLFVAISQGKIPQESWFSLSRSLVTAVHTPVLLSWSGTMFEYLMPLLVMPTYENTLLDESCNGVVKRQIEYGNQQGVPWGMSESCYNIVDAGLIYQYRAFGVPGLGFKRGLGHDLVIAPYASMMALMIDPAAACHNLEVMSNRGFEGRYGFYEAIDYTVSRMPRGQSHVLIQTFMVHHQAMSLLSLAYTLLGKPMQKRFESEAQFQTAMLLLQEQVPKTTGFFSAASDTEEITHVSPNAEFRIINTADTPLPEVQLLSNGRYHVMVTNAGGGYSRWKNIAVTRWREDATCDKQGIFCYLRNMEDSELWSTAFQPVLKKPQSYEVILSNSRAEFRRTDNEFETYTEIIVSPEDDIEIRRVHITNHARTKRKLEITSYAEVVLDLPSADSAHPAFSNLFVQTEIIAHQQAILCTRRPRSNGEKPPYMIHLMMVNGHQTDSISYETDRSKFIGRGNNLAFPAALQSLDPLSGSQGSVLDPMASIQARIMIQSGESILVDIISGISETREGAHGLLDKYQDKQMRNRAFELSWTHSQVVLRQINASESDAQLYGRLASSVIFLNPALRATPDVLVKNQKGQAGLWSYSISGDLPIVLLQISDSSGIALFKQLMQAKAYWQLKGLLVDLVILNEDRSTYRQLLQDEILGLLSSGIHINMASNQGGIFVRFVDQISSEDYVLLQAVSRVIISDKRGNLSDQVNKRIALKTNIPFISGTAVNTIHCKFLPPANLQFHNGLGGFSSDGREYVITVGGKQATPLPWVNVIANKNFGTLISESGSSYTWFENAHEFRLTPWENDPVSDGSGETYYIRDEESGQFWSPMMLPRQSQSSYVIRHGFGVSTFEHQNDGIASKVSVYVDADEAVKFVVIRIRNNSGRLRKLSATGYIEWVLGSERSKSAMHVITELDSDTGSLMSRNTYQAEFSERVAFMDVDDSLYRFTTDRTEFLGRNGTLQNPRAMKRQRLSGKLGAGFDPCAAIQVPFELNHGLEREIIFRIGAGKNIHEARETVRQFRGSESALRAFDRVKDFWNRTLQQVQIETPDTALNILANGWLLYQVISSRLWGRSGFYQSGGAFGFRDQLQDVLALMHTKPGMTRGQILLAASRQYKEGDVQHWWHPPLGRGVRTRCSDDFLWLPYVSSQYILGTGDNSILEESVPFIEGRELNDQEESYYDLPVISAEKSTLYDHCKRAIVHALRFGDHGLPLIGSGDWNDGMNLVGIKGKGESVWLGFFLYDVLQRFIRIAEIQKDTAFSNLCEQQAITLQGNINQNAWDGDWYLRAFFDDGTPIGSARNEECRIDSIPQSWSVLSGAGELAKSIRGLKAANQQLVDRQHDLIKVLDPPFNLTPDDPGYIKGYVPGVRENGGQYTHAAVWMIMAFAKLGDRDRTWELLNMINPINHGATEKGIFRYKAEPYVIAADVYGVAPHEGRGGWTWYSGSAGWTYQLILESFLGIRRAGNQLRINPCTPKEWSMVKVHYRYLETVYTIHIHQPGSGGSTVMVDGVVQPGEIILLVDDRMPHEVVIGQGEVVPIAFVETT